MTEKPRILFIVEGEKLEPEISSAGCISSIIQRYCHRFTGANSSLLPVRADPMVSSSQASSVLSKKPEPSV